MSAECTSTCTQPTLHPSDNLPIVLSMPPDDSRMPSHPIRTSAECILRLNLKSRFRETVC